MAGSPCGSPFDPLRVAGAREFRGRGHGQDDTGAAEPLAERLARIDGFDLDDALKHVAGQMPVLTRVLTRFAETYQDGVPELLNADGAPPEVLARWRKVCHSMRGALATIGATALVRDFRDFEALLVDAQDVEGLRASAADLHEALLALVRALAGELGA